LGRQRPPDSDRPQEVSSLQTPPSSIRFRAVRQAEFPVSRMRNAAWVLHLQRDALVLIWLNHD